MYTAVRCKKSTKNAGPKRRNPDQASGRQSGCARQRCEPRSRFTVEIVTSPTNASILVRGFLVKRTHREGRSTCHGGSEARSRCDSRTVGTKEPMAKQSGRRQCGVAGVKQPGARHTWRSERAGRWAMMSRCSRILWWVASLASWLRCEVRRGCVRRSRGRQRWWYVD